MRSSTLCLFLFTTLVGCASSSEHDAQSTESEITSAASSTTRIHALVAAGLMSDLNASLDASVNPHGIENVLAVYGADPGDNGEAQEEVQLDPLGSRSFLLTQASDASGLELIFPSYRDDDDGALAKKVFDAMTKVTADVHTLNDAQGSFKYEYIERKSPSGRIICRSYRDTTSHRYRCILRKVTQVEQSFEPVTNAP